MKKFIKILFDLAVFISAIVTIIGLYLLFPQAKLINEQLKEINTQPLIKINFNLATTTIRFGPSVSDPLDVVLTVRNEGNRVASYWRGSLVFCKDISVINFEEPWIKENEVINQYLIESQKIVPPSFPEKLKFYSYTLDNIGHFEIVLPNKDNHQLDKPIPIGQITISGDYNNPVSYLILLSYPEGFIYKNLLQENSRMHQDFLRKLEGCFDVIDQTKNNMILTNH